MRTEDFFYELPPGAIAQEAIEPRHAARLLDTRTMSDHHVLDLPQLLEPGDLVVVNRTRVRNARLAARRPTGGAVEILLLRRLAGERWEALARPSRRLKAGSLLEVEDAQLTVVSDPDRGRVVVESGTDLEELAALVGELPLPPYFDGELSDDERYQTMFADRTGSAAAPTAGLHFTEAVLSGLADRGVDYARIDLEVGLDTFRPITEPRVEDHVMHSERIEVDHDAVDAVRRTRDRGGRVAAVGTTVVRSLETAAAGGTLEPYSGPTDLFITPGYSFSAVDLVLTNFHVPGSTLVVLVASILGESWQTVYRAALDRGYRFLSFGDAMLAEVMR